jgi:hypothetical protein
VFCSDAPVSARARIVLAGDQLTITESVQPDNRLDDRPEVDVILRLLTVTGASSSTLSREAGGRLLVLRPNQPITTRLMAGLNIPTRLFARIEPDRLRRLRALLRARELSAIKYWRCFFANATTADPAFARLRTGEHAAPAFLDDAAKVASYLVTMNEALFRPVPDERDPESRKLAAVPLETIMTEQFPDIRVPTTVAEVEALARRFRTLASRLKGEAAVGIPLTAQEFAAFARATSDDPEAKRLFCQD